MAPVHGGGLGLFICVLEESPPTILDIMPDRGGDGLHVDFMKK